MQVLSPSQTVAANVRAEMARHQHSQASLAELIGMRQQALSRRLSGRTDFTVTELATIASALNTTISALVGEVAA